MAARIKTANLQNKQGKLAYFKRVAAGQDGGSANVQQALKQTSLAERAIKLRNPEYQSKLAEVLRFNPEAYEPKRLNMMNFNSSQYDLINFSQRKQPNELVKTSSTEQITSRWVSQAIGVGLPAATMRHDNPCYTEYGISGFEQKGRPVAPNLHTGYQTTLHNNPSAFMREAGMLTTHLDNAKTAIYRKSIRALGQRTVK